LQQVNGDGTVKPTAHSNNNVRFLVHGEKY